ncbi:MAG: sigma-70 family RNA polymerase sigma factor [Candidatus Omnitrophica bacterium]|nr:sigma-70 family RNA polymerase sigma factor [Candidatus Omnitrophota bacterium]
MNDLEFVQRCVKGDKQAWDELVEKYSSLIYNYIHSVLKIKGHNFPQDNINDLFQEIFLCLAKDNFKKLGTFQAKNGASLASWLRQVTVNFTIDYVRKLKPNVSIDAETKNGFNLGEILPCEALSVTDTLNQEEKLAHLKDCVDKLNVDDKFFLELYLNRGLELEELKDYFKISRPAVDMRKSRIIERLRDCFRSKFKALDF